MKSFKSHLAAIATVSALCMAGSANAAYMTNWYLDADGAGSGSEVKVTKWLDLVGSSYVHNTFNSASSFNFNEAGLFTVPFADSSKLLSPMLKADFNGVGTGTVGDKLTFSSGIMAVYSNGNKIADFTLVSGGAKLGAGTVLPAENGTIDLVFKATWMASGYFFDENHIDMSTQLASEILLGFATTNANPVEPDLSVTTKVDKDLLDYYNSKFASVGDDVTHDNVENLYISNNGQFKLQKEVPEPGSLALLGAGLIGLVGLRRRNK